MVGQNLRPFYTLTPQTYDLFLDYYIDLVQDPTGSQSNSHGKSKKIPREVNHTSVMLRARMKRV